MSGQQQKTQMRRDKIKLTLNHRPGCQYLVEWFLNTGSFHITLIVFSVHLIRHSDLSGTHIKSFIRNGLAVRSTGTSAPLQMHWRRVWKTYLVVYLVHFNTNIVRWKQTQDDFYVWHHFGHLCKQAYGRIVRTILKRNCKLYFSTVFHMWMQNCAIQI